MSFSEILDAVEVLPYNEQIELSYLIKMRAIEQKREILFEEVVQADNELLSGNLKIQSVDSIMDDILNEF
ncbi:hypothetical protein MASR1M45_23690 [Candidatus Kapaibacterium sp.]